MTVVRTAKVVIETAYSYPAKFQKVEDGDSSFTSMNLVIRNLKMLLCGFLGGSHARVQTGHRIPERSCDRFILWP